ncbi:MAG: hypothetical protein Q9M76_02395 [Candidatus Dojkabacteria bacterium]|nr:hypothetical protein [Candidatus Dojkabacteria bacterium]
MDRLFRDKNGKIVIAQFPNWPIIGWGIVRLVIISPLFNSKQTELFIISNTFLLIWALMELVSGVNYFRRILGVVILLSLFSSYLL